MQEVNNLINEIEGICEVIVEGYQKISSQ